MFSPREATHGIHRGGVETSLMLAFRPETVRFSEARDFANTAESMERDFAILRARPPLGFAWMAADLNPDGAAGEAAKASFRKGDAAADFGVERFIALLRDVDALDLTRLATGPLGRAG